MQSRMCIEGRHAGLVSDAEMAAGIAAAGEVFSGSEADPLACAAANGKRERGEPLTRDEALQCVIWDQADEAAWRAATLGWLSREVDIRLGISG